jgi:hypothetical protein
LSLGELIAFFLAAWPRREVLEGNELNGWCSEGDE